MNRSDISELHFIVPIDNVPSIMTHGILSHNRSQILNHRDISEEGVQNRRSDKKIPGTNNKLHDYANLYFDAHNPMLCARKSRNNEICVLRINSAILDLNGVIVTDKNAARDCWFKPVDKGLPLLNTNEVFANFWTNDNVFEQDRRKGIKCAEVLVLHCVDSKYIVGAYVANNIALDNFRGISNLPVDIKNGLFF